jgi:hypothetical protein
VERQQLAENGRFKTHYSLITDALRAYVAQTRGIAATDRTTAELKTELKQSTLTTEQAQQFVEMLQASDLVKFARVTPTIADAHALINEARQFIEATKPEPAAQAERPKRKPRRPATQSSILNLHSSHTEARP